MQAGSSETENPAPGVSFNIRIVTLEGSPWFVAADVCRALDLGMAKGAGRYLQHLAADERRTLPPEIFGGKVGTIMGVVGIAESGLYKLTLRSTKPQARAFQDWVTRVVLPAIRTTGSYVVGEEKLSDPAAPRDELEAISEAVEGLLKKKAALLEAWLAATLADKARLGAAFRDCPQIFEASPQDRLD